MRRLILAQGAAVLAIGFIVLFVGGGSRHAIGLVFKPMGETFGWDRSTLGFAVAVFLAVSAFCMFVAGHFADRYPPQRVLAGGLFLSGIGIGAMAFVSEPWQVFVLYGVVFAAGNGAASLAPVGVMVTRQFPDRVGLSNAFVIAGMGLGQLVIIAALTSVLIGLGWRWVFICLGAVNLALAILLPFAAQNQRLPVTDPKTNLQSGLTLRQAAETRQFWLLIVVYAICGFHDFFVATHIVAFALDYGVSTFLAGNLLAAMGLAGLVGVIAAGQWSDTSGPVIATVACFALRAVVFALVFVSKDVQVVTLFALTFGLTFWVTAPLTVVFVRNAFGDKQIGALSGLITMVHHTCGGLGAYAGAVAFDAQANYDLSLAVMAVTAVMGGLLSFDLRQRQSTA